MQYIKASECYQEPLNLWENDTYRKNTLVTKQEQSLVCELIKRKRPKKILEVGVHSGGTTAAILNCIQMLNLDCKLYSVDLVEDIGRGPVGFLIQDSSLKLKTDNWKLYTGCTAAEVIEEIGNDIDFLMLDAAHILPGECLDFLVCYPYLSKNAIVVAHDIFLSNNLYTTKDWNATGILFSSVVADKYLLANDITNPNGSSLCNIGAFQINKDTGKYIENVFQGLHLPWFCMPPEKSVKSALEIIRANYSDILYQRIFQSYYFNIKKRKSEIYFNWDKILKLTKEFNEKILIWGMKGYGGIMHHTLRSLIDDANLKGNNSAYTQKLLQLFKCFYFIDNNIENQDMLLLNYLQPKTILNNSDEIAAVVIGAQSEKSRKEILKELEDIKFPKEKIHFIEEFIDENA